MRLYRLKITGEDEELEDLALCYARSKEEAIKKFEELYTGVKENQVEEVFFNKWNIAILTDY